MTAGRIADGAQARGLDPIFGRVLAHPANGTATIVDGGGIAVHPSLAGGRGLYQWVLAAEGDISALCQGAAERRLEAGSPVAAAPSAAVDENDGRVLDARRLFRRPINVQQQLFAAGFAVLD